MINKYENTHIEINIERAVLNIIIKLQQEHPLCLPILICTECTQESNIFT